ncbi:hypothetical protein FOL47_006454 [Perkinsus chesapeaki]|uniref:Ferric reductase NAD binding domain-containing protein n=1 Tax=Perkinsus chesapeaki TaxID=330153 RepID=A0A7J6MXE3_PERCH|nr:hypothetical protein FOL47_006454 [Perkinsus chesapeaki]
MNTDEDGIPDVKQYISRVCAEVGGEEQIGLFVCGPVPLQNACWSAYLHCRNSFNNVAGFHAEVFRFI